MNRSAASFAPRRSSSATRKPSSSKTAAMAVPIPPVPPVTIATGALMTHAPSHRAAQNVALPVCGAGFELDDHARYRPGYWLVDMAWPLQSRHWR